MKLQYSFLALVFSIFSLLILSSAKDFDFFYFVQQWPGSFCDTKIGCCFPNTGKPAADFGIHGLWPNYAQCRRDLDLDILTRKKKCYPDYCDDMDPLNPWEIRDLIKSLQKHWPTLSCKNRKSMDFWRYEWKKHGTCSNEILDQHSYFEAALNIKIQYNLTQILSDAGIEPNGETYYLSSIRDAITTATGFVPGIECNRNEFRDTQLYQIYLCVDRTGQRLIECPLLPHGKCVDKVKFPAF